MRAVVLSGFMGTGKSTVGPLVAEKLGLAFVDADAVLEQEGGAPVADLWQREGEPAFRARETRLVTRILGDDAPRVIAFGGGTVTQRGLRHFALDRATLVTLTASPATVLARVGDARTRPNLDVGPVTTPASDAIGPEARRAGRIRELLEQRADAYAEAHATLPTDGRSPEQLATEIVAIARREPLVVPLGPRSYTIDVQREDATALVAAHVCALGASRVLVVSDENVARARAQALDAIERALGAPCTRVILRAGEAHKTLASVETIWDAALAAGIDRRAVVLALGGGVVTDLAGFAASTLLRGLRVVQVPTTLLAMVDASVGGKTGFDRASGKNMIGSFHQPRAVVLDLAHLETLPPRELCAGLAEAVKIALATDAALLQAIEGCAPALRSGDPAALLPIVRQAVTAKARVVRDDETEAGARALLNLGHTVGHALEAHGQFVDYLHGEAVAIGTIAELAMGARLGWTPPALVDRARAILQSLGLPCAVSVADLEAAWGFVGSDKKRDGAQLRLPVVREPGVATVESVSFADARRALGLPCGVG